MKLMFSFLQDYSDNTRLWIYQSPRSFTAEEISFLNREGAAFSESWKTHGTSLKAQVKVLLDRFVIIAADQDITANSGCSIDSSVRFIKGVEQHTGLNLMDRMLVYYLNEAGEPIPFHFHDLGKLVEQGTINASTKIFNPLVNTKPDLINGWIKPLDASWMATFVK